MNVLEQLIIAQPVLLPPESMFQIVLVKMENTMMDPTPNVIIVHQFVPPVLAIQLVPAVLHPEYKTHQLVLVLKENSKKNNMVLVIHVLINVKHVQELKPIVQSVPLVEKTTHQHVIVTKVIPKSMVFVPNVIQTDVKIVNLLLIIALFVKLQESILYQDVHVLMVIMKMLLKYVHYVIINV